MDARDAPHLRSIHSTVAASSHHRQSDPFPQNNLDYPNHPKFWSDPNVSKSARYQSTPAQELRDNELEVALSFENRDGFNGIALMDTGAKDNWISDSLCRQLILPRKSFREEIFEGFGGTPVGCNESVHGYWHYGHQTFPITFKISKDLPVNVLFGLDLLRQVNLVNFKEDNKANLEKVLILTKLKAKKGQSALVHSSMKELAANREMHR